MRTIASLPSRCSVRWHAPALAQLIAGLCMLTGLSGGSIAEAKKMAIAPFGALGVAPSEAREIERHARKIVAQLPGLRLLPRERLARPLRGPRNYGCAERPRCIGSLGRRVGAAVVLLGDVGGIAGKHVVHLKLVSAAGTLSGSETVVLTAAAESDSKDLRAALVKLLLPRRYVGSLEVEIDVDGAWIYLDGRRVARGRRAQLPRLSVGTHALRITHEAYRDHVQFVRIRFGRRTSVKAELRAFRTHVEEMRLRNQKEPLTSAELPWYRRWWAVAAFGALVLTAAATTVAVLPRSAAPDRRVTVGELPGS
jgi:hypothetical protein